MMLRSAVGPRRGRVTADAVRSTRKVVRMAGVGGVIAGEAAAMGEFARLMSDPIFYGAGLPRGDGRLVTVLPGMFANDVYLQPMRTWLRRIGYRPVRSTLSMNLGCPQRLTERIEGEIERQLGRRQSPVAIIGHSRGGILARAIAARLGADASHLVLLGSPVGGILRMDRWSAARDEAPAAGRAMADASSRARRYTDPDCNVPDCGCPFPADLARPLHASTRVVSIFSRDDPIVPAAMCRVRGARNVEVSGTHSGLAYNRAALREIAQTLAGR
jgi:hypothetical protein